MHLDIPDSWYTQIAGYVPWCEMWFMCIVGGDYVVARCVMPVRAVALLTSCAIALLQRQSLWARVKAKVCVPSRLFSCWRQSVGYRLATDPDRLYLMECIFLCLSLSLSLYIYICVYIYIYVYTRIYLDAYMYAYKYIYIYIYIYVYTHTTHF